MKSASNPRSAALLTLLVAAGACWPVIFSGYMIGRGAEDQLEFHEPTIRQFLAQWPHPDLRDYPSATTPGYHLLLALFARITGDHVVAWQWFSSLLSLALVALLAAACARRVAWPLAVALTLPVFASPYVFASAVWLLPDNLAWGLVLIVMLLALEPPTARTCLAASLALVALVLVRQNHIWAAAVVWTSLWISEERTSLPARARRLVTAVLVTAPAAFVLFAFLRLWHGLTPLRFQQVHEAGFSWAAPAFAFGCLAVFSVFYLPVLWPSLRELFLQHRRLLAAAVLVGLLTALLPATTESWEAGRASGLWHLAGRLPTFGAHTSLLWVVLSPLGAIALVAWLLSLPASSIRQRWCMLVAFAAFVLAQCANSKLYQRYFEPMLLIWIALAAAMSLEDRWALMARPRRAASAAGAVALGAVLMAVTIVTLRR